MTIQSIVCLSLEYSLIGLTSYYSLLKGVMFFKKKLRALKYRFQNQDFIPGERNGDISFITF